MEPNYIPLKKIFGKHSEVIYLLFLIAWTVAAFLGGKASVNVNINNNIRSGDSTLGAEAPGPVLTPTPLSILDQCPAHSASDANKDWDLTRYHMGKDMKICANVWASWPYPDLTYNTTISQTFKSVFISYTIDNKDGYSNPFVISVGEKTKLIRFFIQESNPQMIGYESLDLSTMTLKRGTPDILESAPAKGTKIEATLRSAVKKQNEITYTLNIKYVSSGGDPREDSFSHDVTLPEPSVDSKTSINIGVSRGKCFTLSSYKVCE